MRHEVITTIDGWKSLSNEWRVRNTRADSIFITWEWLDSWIEAQRIPPRLCVICVRNETGELVGMAPFYMDSYRLSRTLPYRVLRVIGGTDSGAEYQVWIARQQIEREVFREIVNALRIMRSEWDLIWMPSLEGWSGLTDNLIDAMREGGFWVNCRSCKFSSVALPNDFESYLNSMSPNRRQQTRRMCRRILENSDVQIRKIESTAELADALATLFDLHARRWHAVGKEGVFASRPIEKKFYETFTPRALSNGWLAIYILSDLGQPKAIQFGYVYNNLFLQLQEGFDPEYAAHVGNVLRAHVIENCINDGIEEYDFLGGVSEHKRRWMAEERSGMDLLAARSCLKNFPIMRFGVWPTGAYLRPDECDLVH